MSPKSTHFEAFEEIYQVVIDGISDNMASFSQYGKYGAINTPDTTKIYSMLLSSYQRHKRCKIIQQLTDKSFMRVK